MNDTRMTIPLGGKEFILIGTAHVSRESIDEVSGIIRNEKPDLICVELDETRYASITRKESWENLNMVKVFKEGKGFLLIANLVLSGFQRRMGAGLGVKPGEEMKTALDIAGELNIPHALCDREIHVTLRRAWARCNFWKKSKLMATLLTSAFTTEKLKPEEIENLKNRSELDGMMNELAGYLPEVKETLIDERDRYMAAKIWEAAAALPPPKEPEMPFVVIPGAVDFISPEYMTPVIIPRPPRVPRILAVVGAGHMRGLKTRLEKIAAGEQSADVRGITVIPPKGVVSKILPVIIPLVIVGLLVFGFFKAGPSVSVSMLLRYVLWNGSLAALGALIALGHPLSILVSFVGAPITSMLPFVGIGLFSGITQASMRKPRVADAQTIIEDVGSIKGFYRNRITRALLVFFLSSIGSMAGTFISVPAIAAQLIK